MKHKDKPRFTSLRDVYRDLHKGLYNYNGRWHRRYFDVVQLARLTDARSFLDCGCEYGQVITALKCMGHRVCGTTQIETCRDHLKKTVIPSMLMTYEELGKIKSDKFDCVISNDVLEHLESEKQVLNALRNMVRISRSWVIFAIGRKRSRLGRPYGIENLHTFVKPQEWWSERISDLVELQPLPLFLNGNPDGSPVHEAHMFLGKK